MSEREGKILSDAEVYTIMATHMGHQVGVTRLAATPERVVSIDCLTCGKNGKDLRLWPQKN